MNFKDNINRVRRAELAVEANEGVARDHWQRLRLAWRDAWTPGRIVIAGLASGFLVGRIDPKATGAGMVNLVSALASLFAVDQAGNAAEVAGDAAEVAGDAADNAQQASEAAATTDAVTGASHDEAVRTHEALRRTGVL